MAGDNRASKALMLAAGRTGAGHGLHTNRQLTACFDWCHHSCIRVCARATICLRGADYPDILQTVHAAAHTWTSQL